PPTLYPLGAKNRPKTTPPPPLSPGPATTTTRRQSTALQATSATARPAFFINLKPGMPPAIVRRSASAISAVVSNSFIVNKPNTGYGPNGLISCAATVFGGG